MFTTKPPPAATKEGSGAWKTSSREPPSPESTRSGRTAGSFDAAGAGFPATAGTVAGFVSTSADKPGGPPGSGTGTFVRPQTVFQPRSFTCWSYMNVVLIMNKALHEYLNHI
ncbi:MAG: hypothetical protein U1F77_03450 [Kiritimatiellia bacterium]